MLVIFDEHQGHASALCFGESQLQHLELAGQLFLIMQKGGP